MAKTIDESSHYRLICEYETTFLINKINGEKRMLSQHYGDPTSGVISPNQNWVVCGEQGIKLLCIETAVSREYIAGTNIHDMRLESSTSIRILVDPSQIKMPHGSSTSNLYK